MTALVRGVALGVTPDGPEAETYTVGDRVTYTAFPHHRYETGHDRWPATVVEVWDDCIEIQVDHYDGTHLVFARELRHLKAVAS